MNQGGVFLTSINAGRDQTGYFSVQSSQTAEIVIKRSRFIAQVSPVLNVDEAETLIEATRERYRDATHVCYAYHIGLETTMSKMSDDGEPKGTAGRPILEVIERREIENVCVTVVRYYGGTQLGAAGLVRAYSAAAVAAVDKATIVAYKVHTRLYMTMTYGEWAKIEHLFPVWGGQLLNATYGEHIRLEATVSLDRRKELTKNLIDATGGTIEIETGISEYRPME